MVSLPYTIEGFRPLTSAPVVEALPPRGKKPPYLSEAVFLDTETSNNYDEDRHTGCGWIYQWCFNFAGYDCIGRRPDELILDLEDAVMPSVKRCPEGTKCLVFVHNLSYDIQYLKDFLIEQYEDFQILATSPHKFITFSAGPFEFRCSYKLSNRSLSKWGSDLGIEHQKKKGLVDYAALHYQDSELTYDDWLYMLYDVWSLRDCVKKQMHIYGDVLSTCPLTSTGYIRRDARNRYKENLQENRPEFLASKPTVRVYKALNGAMAGGIAHGNRLFEDVLVETDEIWYKRPDAYERDEPIDGIDHVDYRSHYPSQEAGSDEVYGFPKDKFCLRWEYIPGVTKEVLTFDTIDRWSVENCVLLEIVLHDAELKPGVSLPYLQTYKLFEGRCSDFAHTIEDNGRLLKMKGSARIYVTEWDLKWIRKQYDFSYMIKTVWTSPRGAIPKYLRDTIDENFLKKTVLKDKVKHLEDIGADEWEVINAKIDLMKSKNGLNGIYGMTATDPVRPEITMDEYGEWTVPIKDDDMIKEKLDEYYKNYNSFMVYAYGVYTTALARNELMEAVEAIGYKYFLYCDTDSIFFLRNDKVKARFEAINRWRNIRAEKIGAYVIKPDGQKVYYDVLEVEKEHITSFKYIHAKAYAYITDGGTEKEKLHCTIAGVSEYSPDYVPADKHKGLPQQGMSRVDELGCIENLKHGTEFHFTGGTRCIYIEGRPRLENINGHMTMCSSAAIIKDVTKTLSGPIAKNEVWVSWEVFEEFE